MKMLYDSGVGDSGILFLFAIFLLLISERPKRCKTGWAPLGSKDTGRATAESILGYLEQGSIFGIG